MATIHFIMGHEGLPLNRFAGTSWTEIPKRLINYLNENKVRYEILHQPKDWSTRKPQPRTARYYTKVVIVRAGPQHLVSEFRSNACIDIQRSCAVGKPLRAATANKLSKPVSQCS